MFLAAWVIFFDFVAVWISGHPANPAFGFHPSWGYAAQLFTYQQTLLIVETACRIGSRNELIVARLIGQLIGIATAVIISCTVFPTFANRCAKSRLRDALHCLETAFVYQAGKLNATSPAEIERYEKHVDEALSHGREHLDRCGQIIKDNEVFDEVTWLRTHPIMFRTTNCVDRLLEFQNSFRTLDAFYIQHCHPIPDEEQSISARAVLDSTDRLLAVGDQHMKNLMILIRKALGGSRKFRPRRQLFNTACRLIINEAEAIQRQVLDNLLELNGLLVHPGTQNDDPGQYDAFKSGITEFAELLSTVWDRKRGWWSYSVVLLNELELLASFVETFLDGDVEDANE